MRQRKVRPKRFITESLERRVFFSATAAGPIAGAHPTYALLAGSGVHPLATGSAAQVTPAQMVQAYGVNGISFGGVTGDGTGQTIAIVDAYDDPNALSDLQTFDSTYGLANPPSFSKLNENGGTSLPPTDTVDPKGNTWELEESLDIEWAHVIAPKANLILYEASSTSYTDLVTHAVATAAANAAVSVVSMSFGGGLATSLDSTFTTPSSRTGGVTFVASTGDSGSPGGYPAYSPNVVAVGGTTLILDPTTHAWQSETGWSGSGGGLGTGSGDEPRPAGHVEEACAARGVDGVQHRSSGLRRQRAEGVAIELSGAFPAGVFEVVEGVRIRIVILPCPAPFEPDGVPECQGFCSTELELFRAVLGRGARVERTEHIIAGDRRCVYQVTPSSAGARRRARPGGAPLRRLPGTRP